MFTLITCTLVSYTHDIIKHNYICIFNSVYVLAFTAFTLKPVTGSACCDCGELCERGPVI